MKYQRRIGALIGFALLVFSIAPPACADEDLGRGGAHHGPGFGVPADIFRGLLTDRPTPNAGPPPPDQPTAEPPYSPGPYPPGGYPPNPSSPGTTTEYPQPYPPSGQTTTDGSVPPRSTAPPPKKRARVPDDPADVPAPRSTYTSHKKNGDECPQRGMGCAALIINYYPAELGAENGNVDGFIKQLKDVGCHVDYIAPEVKFRLAKTKGIGDDEAKKIDSQNSEIDTHNQKVHESIVKTITVHQDLVKNEKISIPEITEQPTTMCALGS